MGTTKTGIVKDGMALYRTADHSKIKQLQDYEPSDTVRYSIDNLLCNQGVAGSNPAAGTSKNNGLDHFNYCDFATSKHIVSTLKGVVSISPRA